MTKSAAITFEELPVGEGLGLSLLVNWRANWSATKSQDWYLVLDGKEYRFTFRGSELLDPVPPTVQDFNPRGMRAVHDLIPVSARRTDSSWALYSNEYLTTPLFHVRIPYWKGHLSSTIYKNLLRSEFKKRADTFYSQLVPEIMAKAKTNPKAAEIELRGELERLLDSQLRYIV